MKTTIDASGRLVVPKAMRERLRIVGGGEVELDEHDGVLEVRPVSTAVRIVETDDGPVAVPLEDIPPLSDEIVRATIDLVRR